MKNHKVVNGKLLQENKKWSQLKNNQKELIYNYLREQYVLFGKNNYNKIPNKEQKIDILDNTYSFIKEKDIWIPYAEVRKFLISKSNKLNTLIKKGVI